MRKILIITVLVLGSLGSTAAANTFRALPGKTIPALTFRLATGRSQRACTRGIAASVQIAPSVRLNGRTLQSSTNDGGWIVSYAGTGTLVQLHSYPGNGPVCAQAMTWLPHASVTVRFDVIK